MQYIEKSKQIRYSTDKDLEEILKWISEQEQTGIEDTFYSNRNLTIEMHQKGKLIVYIDPNTDKAIAYQWGSLISPGITEVRVDKRGQGIGKKLVEYRIQEARENNLVLLQIQCEPRSSIPFWKHMGFQLYGGQFGNNAFMLLEKKHTLPSDGKPCMTEICFYPERRKWEPDTPALKIFTAQGIIKDNIIYLPERISYYDPSYQINKDPVVSISVDNELIYLDKAKYEKAYNLGVKRDDSAFFLDEIHI